MAKSTINPTVYNQLYRNQVNRGEQTREDDDYIKIPEITIYDVDYAILQYIRNNIKPEVQDRDRMIDVPVMYGSGELWSQIQSNGFMRDEKNKLLCPVITLSRTRMEEYKDFAKLDVNNRVSSRVYYRQGYTQNSNRYGSNNRGNTDLPQKEIYITLIPEYYYVYYDLNIWTDFNEQLNKVVEMFIPVNNFVWGNDYQFVTNIEDFSFSTVNISKQERIVKASTRLRVLATLMPAFVERKSSIQKALSIKKVSVAERVINDKNVVESEPSRTRVFKTISLQSNISAISSLSADISFVQKLQSSLSASASLFASALVSKLASSSLTGAGTLAAELTVTSGASLLLDLYPNAAAAYSLRKLRSAYTGSAIRVRRSSDNTEQDIGFVNNVLDTTALTTFCGAGNGFVTTWYDQSGNAYNATETTAANQPQIVSSGSIILDNNKPCVSYYNTACRLQATTTALNTAAALCTFEVFSSNAAAASDTNTVITWNLGDNNVSSNILGKASSTGLINGEYMMFDVRRSLDGSERLGSSSYRRNSNTQVLESSNFINTGVSFYQNNNLITLNLSSAGASISTNYTPANGNITGKLWLGVIFVSPSTYVSVIAKFSEMIFYPTNQLSNRINIQTNINTHYAIY